MEQKPLVIVHKNEGRPLRPEFQKLRELQFEVVEAPSFAMKPGFGRFPPRNEIGSLVFLGGLVPAIAQDYVLFCEPDMLFTRAPQYDSRLAGEYYGYLFYEHDRVQRVLGKYHLADRTGRLNANARIGVPYLIPKSEIARLASRWLEVLDSFEELHWIDIMYAFGIALDLEGGAADVTRLMTTNFRSMDSLTSPVIHYGYGDRFFSKHDFRNSSPLSFRTEAMPRGVPGTVVGEILRQLAAARDFYDAALFQYAANIQNPPCAVESSGLSLVKL